MITDKQKQWVVWGVLVVFIAVMGFLGIKFPISVPPAPETAQQQALSPDAFTRFGSVEVNQLRVKNNEEHTGIETHSGTETHTGAATYSGATTINDLTATTITATTLISQAVGFNATGHTSIVSTTVTGPLTVTGATILNGGISADTSAFTVADTTGNTVVSGTLNVSSTMSLAGVSFTGPMKYGTAVTYATGASIAHGFATTPTVCLLWPTEVTATVTITTTGFSCDTADHATPVMWLCGQ